MRYGGYLVVIIVVVVSGKVEPAEAEFAQIFDVPPYAGVLNTLGSDTQVNLHHGGALQGSFSVRGGELNVFGGAIGNHLDVSMGGVANIYNGIIGNSVEVETDSVMNVFGGNIGPAFDAYFGGIVNLYDGIIGNGFRAHGGVLNMYGGSIGRLPDIEAGGVLTLRGGAIGEGLEIHAYSTFNLYGGTFGQGIGSYDGLNVNGDAKFNIFGKSFLLDGQPIAGMSPGQPYVLEPRDVTVSGILADSSPFSYHLFSAGIYVAPDSTVTLTLVPEPGGLALALPLMAIVAARLPRRPVQRA